MKKMLFLILVVIMVFSILSGCTTNRDNNNVSPNISSPVITSGTNQGGQGNQGGQSGQGGQSDQGGQSGTSAGVSGLPRTSAS